MSTDRDNDIVTDLTRRLTSLEAERGAVHALRESAAELALQRAREIDRLTRALQAARGDFAEVVLACEQNKTATALDIARRALAALDGTPGEKPWKVAQRIPLCECGTPPEPHAPHDLRVSSDGETVRMSIDGKESTHAATPAAPPSRSIQRRVALAKGLEMPTFSTPGSNVPDPTPAAPMCATCRGRGKVPTDFPAMTCPACNGSGRPLHPHPTEESR